MLSNFINNRNVRIHPEQKIVKSKSLRIKTELGPGAYSIKDSTFEVCTFSKFKNPPSGVFGKSRRPDLADSSKISLPGFKYHQFSEFGMLS